MPRVYDNELDICTTYIIKKSKPALYFSMPFTFLYPIKMCLMYKGLFNAFEQTVESTINFMIYVWEYS
jgi:hypothetical protein